MSESEVVTTAPDEAPKKKRTMSPELKEKLRLGRERAKQERERLKREAAQAALGIAAPRPVITVVEDDDDDENADQDDDDGPVSWEAEHEVEDEEEAAAAPELAPARPAVQRAQTIDDVARKHVAPAVYPTPQEVARTTPVAYGPTSAIPPVESDPHKRDAPTTTPTGHVNPDLLDNDHRPQPRTLEDLFALFSIGDGQHYVSVYRRAPKTYGSVPCEGRQRPIRRYMTADEFTQEYGGGEYMLTVYGPPRRGGQYDPAIGGMRPKSLTDPVKHVVPLGAYPPNLLSAWSEETDVYEEDDMRAYGPAFSTGNGRPPGGYGVRPPTSADAKIHEANLTHQEKQLERAEARERELKERLMQQPAEVQAQMRPMFELMLQESRDAREAVRQQAEQAVRLAKEQAEREQAERERERERAEQASASARAAAEKADRDKPDPFDGAVRVLQVMRPSEQMTQAELQRITESHRADLERMQRAHQDDLRRAEDRIKDIETRADNRARDAEQRAEARVREADEKAERRVQQAKEDADRRLQDLERISNQRIDDERRNHDRDKQVLETSWQTRLDGLKSMYENRISTMLENSSSLKSDLERARAEAEARKDIAKSVREFKETATAIGMVEAGAQGAEEEEAGPKTWKDVAVSVGTQLPSIIKSAMDTVQNMRGGGAAVSPAHYMPQQHMAGMPQLPMPTQHMPPGPPPAPRQMPGPLRGRGGVPIAARPLAWATDGSGGVGFGGSDDAPEARYPESLIREPVEAFQPQAPMMHPPAAVQQPAASVPQAVMHPPVQPPPVQQQPIAAPAQQPVPLAGIGPEQIAGFREALEKAVLSNADPADEARDLVNALGVPMAKQIADNLTPERVVAIIQSQPGGSQSPLLRRDGQKFLRELWQAVKRLTS